MVEQPALEDPVYANARGVARTISHQLQQRRERLENYLSQTTPEQTIPRQEALSQRIEDLHQLENELNTITRELWDQEELGRLRKP